VSHPQEKRQLVLDVDVGIDDAVMMLSIAAEPGAEIVAVGSTHGNCSAVQAAENVLRVLEPVGLDDVPVAQGVELQAGNVAYAAHVHGHDGLADIGFSPPRGKVTGESAVDQLLRLSLARPGELDLVAVGAMTNLGLALERDPEVLARYRSVWVLATYSREPRPGDPVTVDANTHASPDACDRVLASGAPLHIIPVDTTNYSILEDDQNERLRTATTPHGRFAWQILPYYFNFYQGLLGHWTARIHDPLVSAALLDPTLITSTVRRPIYVEPFEGRHRAVGRESGELRDRLTRAPVEIVTAADQRRYLDRFVDAMITPLGELPPIPLF
jgi:inosine-uridine nucleoside N-ribohydrolase